MTESLDLESLEPSFLGPTWQRNDDGSWYLPEKTLGWQIAGWCAEWLKNDEGDGPWEFTLEQLRWLLWWYAVDENGRFVYRKGVLQRLKGWGKDPVGAVLCLVELVGPCLFSHWDKDGNPVGKENPKAWVQVAAVSKDQTKNTMTLFPALMSDAFVARYQINAGAEIIRALGGRRRLEAVTSNFRTLEGARSTFVLLNETHHWIASNQGHQMHQTVDGNVTKRDARYLAITNAYLPGEDSVAEHMREGYEKFLEGRAVDIGLMYDTIEAHPKTPMTAEALRVVIPKIRGDAVWLNVETIIASVMDTTIPVSRSRRMWLNQIVADEDALYSRADWDVLTDFDAMPKAGDEVVLGFDGGKTDDATALVALRVSDMTAFLLGLWEKPDGPQGEGWEVDKHKVDSAVHEAHKLFTVRGMYADVALWESYISEWADTYAEGYSVKAPGNGIAWDMRQSKKRSTMAHERLMASIFDRKLRHNGDRSLRRHALNAKRRENDYGVSFGKESRESKRKVDAYAALMLAHECLMDLRAKGKEVRSRTGRGWFL